MDNHSAVTKVVAKPAIGLKIAGGLGAVCCVLGALACILRFLYGGEYGGRAFVGLMLEVGFYIPWLSVGVLTFVAGTKLAILNNRKLVLLAAILSIVPVCVYTFIWPVSAAVGIWTIMVIRRPEVEAAFE